MTNTNPNQTYTRDEMLAAMKKVVSENLGVAENLIQDDSKFTTDLGADSLDTVELVMSMEEEFDMEIPDEAAEKFTCIREAADYIEQNRATSTSFGTGQSR